MRHGAEQPHGVGVLWLAKQCRHWRLLHDAPGVHHGHLVGHLGHHAKVVRDQQHRRAAVLLQALHQLQNLGLDGDIQRRGGFVGNQQPGRVGQRHGDHDALAHAARQFVRVFVKALRRRRNAHPLQHGQRQGLGLLAADRAVPQQHLDDLLPHREGRVE